MHRWMDVKSPIPQVKLREPKFEESQKIDEVIYVYGATSIGGGFISRHSLFESSRTLLDILNENVNLERHSRL